MQETVKEDEKTTRERVAKAKSQLEMELADALEDRFRASDPPSITQPGLAAGAPEGRKSVK